MKKCVPAKYKYFSFCGVPLVWIYHTIYGSEYTIPYRSQGVAELQIKLKPSSRPPQYLSISTKYFPTIFVIQCSAFLFVCLVNFKFEF